MDPLRHRRGTVCNAPGGLENRSEKWTYFWSRKMIRKNWNPRQSLPRLACPCEALPSFAKLCESLPTIAKPCPFCCSLCSSCCSSAAPLLLLCCSSAALGWHSCVPPGCVWRLLTRIWLVRQKKAPKNASIPENNGNINRKLLFNLPERHPLTSLNVP